MGKKRLVKKNAALSGLLMLSLVISTSVWADELSDGSVSAQLEDQQDGSTESANVPSFSTEDSSLSLGEGVENEGVQASQEFTSELSHESMVVADDSSLTDDMASSIIVVGDDEPVVSTDDVIVFDDESDSEGGLFLMAASGLENTEPTINEADFEISDEGVLTKYKGNGGAVTLPSRVTSIGDNAFNNDGGHLVTTVSLLAESAGLTSIGNAAFKDCNVLKSVQVTVSNAKLTSIGNNAFRGCISLDTFEMPSTLASIGASSFYGCISLNDIAIPSGITEIPDSVFQGCTTLANLSLPSSLLKIGNYVFSGCTNIENIDIPVNVKSIGAYAFSGSAIKAAVIPLGVTELSNHLFYRCTNLNIVTLNGQVTSVGESAFQGCTGLSKIVLDETSSAGTFLLPTSVTVVGKNAFNGCTSMERINLPNGLVAIQEGTFSGCTSLSVITIDADDSNITSIGKEAFKNCSKLNAFAIPYKVTSILQSAFSGTGLIDVQIPGAVTSFMDGVFQGCTKLRTVDIAGNVSTIFANSFQGCTSLLSISLPDSVVSIQEGAFSGCSSLATVRMPEGNTKFTEIKSSVFSGCSALTTIDIPAYVHTIGASAFSGCTSLAVVNFKSAGNLKNIGASAFSGCTSLASIVVPESNTITLPGSTEVIGNKAFSNCALPSMRVPASVTSLGESAFSGCSSMASIELLLSVNQLQSSLFSNCSALTNVTIPNSVESIGASVFSNCTALTSVEWEPKEQSELKTIGASAFSGTSSLGELELPSATVTSIDKSAFTKSGVTIKAPCGSYCANWAIQQNIKRNITDHNSTVEDAAVEATCTQAGKKAGSHCGECGDAIVPQEEIPALGHNLTAHTYVAATCESEGSKAYWSCDRCKKYFTSAAATTEYQKDGWVIPAKDHQYGNLIAEKDATCKATGMKAHYYCSSCKSYFDDNKVKTTEDDLTIPVLNHTLERFEAHDATCTENGNSEYWHCTACDQYFSDADGKTVIRNNSWVIMAAHNYGSLVPATSATCMEEGVAAHYHCSACGKYFNSSKVEKTLAELTTAARGHSLTVKSAVDPTCTRTGNSAYWYCSRCRKYFSDGRATNEVAINSWVLPATGHTWDGGVVTRAATATRTGVITYTCIDCNSKRTETIPVTGNSGSTIVDGLITESASNTGSGSFAISKSPSSVKAKAKKNKVTVSWKKLNKKKEKKLLSQISSIQVQYSTDRSFASNVGIKTVGKKKAKVTLRLQKKMTYYVRVRFIGNGGYSNWSGVKTVKTK